MRFLLLATGLLLAAAPADAVAPKHAPAGRGHLAKPAAKPAPRPNWLQTIARTPDGGMRMGNPQAPVKLVEYGSRTCPHCAHFDADGVPTLKTRYVASGQVSYEFRDFPVHGILDVGPILLGQCVAPAQFFPMLAGMMAAQPQLMKKDEIPAAEQTKLGTMKPVAVAAYLADYYGYVAFVTRHGVTPARARACLADQKALDAVARNADAASTRYTVQGTPTFIVNGQVAKNVYDWATLEPILRAAGAK